MDEKSLNAISLLDALTNSRNKLGDFAFSMHIQHRSELKSVQSNVDLLNYFGKCFPALTNHPDGALMLAVETTLPTGDVVEWNIELCWYNNQWVIETNIGIIDRETRRKVNVKSDETRVATTMEDCIQSLEIATDFIINSGDAFAIQELANNNKK